MPMHLRSSRGIGFSCICFKRKALSSLYAVRGNAFICSNTANHLLEGFDIMFFRRTREERGKT